MHRASIRLQLFFNYCSADKSLEVSWLLVIDGCPYVDALHAPLLLSTPLVEYPVMPPSVPTRRRLRFGPYEADLHSRELRKDGIRLRLQAQPFQLLAILLERPGELVTREEICQKLWSTETFVDFDHSLGTAINKIREILNDSAGEPCYVETLPRRGYRFIAPVTSVGPEPAIESPAPKPVGPSEPVASLPTRSRFFYAAVVVCFAVAVLLVLIGANFRGWLPKVASAEDGAPPTVKSIAVLPLLNLSNDPEQQFFADGMTDELITNLARISSLRIISHTSTMAYLGTHKPAAQIARELGVDALVEGSVVRSGSKVRITAQLIHAASDRHLWAQSYNRDPSDVLTVQGEVAREIAERISAFLTPQEKAELSRQRPVSPEVAILYFKGSYFLSQLDAARARDTFTQAIHLEPNNADLWAGLADALHTMAVLGDFENFPAARDAAIKALGIDGSQAQALMVLGVISFLYDWNPPQSEEYFRRSIEARPSYAMSHALFANMLAHRGKSQEAIEQIKLANTLDPVSVVTNSFAWHVYFCARQYDDALRAILGTAEANPAFAPAPWRLSLSWEQKGEYEKAIAAGDEGAPELRRAFASGGVRAYWQRKLEILLPDKYGSTAIARCYMHLGEREEALKTLEKGYRMRDPYLIFWLPIFEEFDPLRSDPRFQKMLHGLGFS
jgi:TolB-like protein/DNA-binding winged helix-turn-helix (wHTH) protein/Tfp pilus assembly protein PilF